MRFIRYAMLLAVLTTAPCTLAQLYAKRIAWGLSYPVGFYPDPVNTKRNYVVQLDGRIRSMNGHTILADLLTFPEGELARNGEQGLLGLAFHPNYAQNGYIFVYYTRYDRALCVSRFTVVNGVADFATRYNIIAVAHPVNNNHNGGTIRFGPDGYLYIATGDGGSGNDPSNNAQDLNSMLGKVLRIDVNRDAFHKHPNKNYACPDGNPWKGPTPGLAELWAYGLRNPYKWCFDTNSAMIIADVGQGRIEEIDLLPAGQSGYNFGWRAMEGSLDNPKVSDAEPANHTYPIFEYDHTYGRSIIGGQVYRGTLLGPEYVGRYFFGDYISARIWSIDPYAADVRSTFVEHTPDVRYIKCSSIDLDRNGELIICDLRGQVYRIIRDP